MDANRFDDVARTLIRGTSRRTALGLALATLVTPLGSTEGDARRRRNRKKRRQQQQQQQQCGAGVCGVCQSCQQSTCVPVADGTDCGNCQTCQGGQCASCPQNQVCCENVGKCKDVRNDSAFCGQCSNGRCPGGAFCANGACGLTCNTDGGPCFDPDCACADRVDPPHAGQKVCASSSRPHAPPIPNATRTLTAPQARSASGKCASVASAQSGTSVPVPCA